MPQTDESISQSSDCDILVQQSPLKKISMSDVVDFQAIIDERQKVYNRMKKQRTLKKEVESLKREWSIL